MGYFDNASAAQKSFLFDYLFEKLKNNEEFAKVLSEANEEFEKNCCN